LRVESLHHLLLLGIESFLPVKSTTTGASIRFALDGFSLLESFLNVANLHLSAHDQVVLVVQHESGVGLN
jgi:hypothetical protein